MQEGGTGTRAGKGFSPPRPPLTRATQIPHPRRAISAYHTRAHAGIRYITILYSTVPYYTIPARERARKQGRREYVRDKYK